MPKETITELPLTTLVDAALQLGIDYQAAHRLVLTRQLDGVQRGKRSWFVTVASVRRYRRKLAAAR